MDLQSKVSLENHPVIVDLRTARQKNAAVLKTLAIEEKEPDEKKDAHGIAFSVASLVTRHTEKEEPKRDAGPKEPEAQTTLADTGFF